MSSHIIQRLRQNAVDLMVKDQDVKKLADIVAELCLVCENQEKVIADLTEQIAALQQNDAETAGAV